MSRRLESLTERELVARWRECWQVNRSAREAMNDPRADAGARSEARRRNRASGRRLVRLRQEFRRRRLALPAPPAPFPAREPAPHPALRDLVESWRRSSLLRVAALIRCERAIAGHDPALLDLLTDLRRAESSTIESVTRFLADGADAAGTPWKERKTAERGHK